jgi:hypothetical protein
VKPVGIASALVVGFVGIVLSAALLNGFMLSYLWEWFVVPLGVRSIRIAQAIGLAMIVSMLTYKHQEPKEDEDALSKLIASMTVKLVAFGIAFGVSFLVPA